MRGPLPVGVRGHELEVTSNTPSPLEGGMSVMLVGSFEDPEEREDHDEEDPPCFPTQCVRTRWPFRRWCAWEGSNPQPSDP